MDPTLPTGARARDRGRPHRRRRRHPRDRAAPALTASTSAGACVLPASATRTSTSRPGRSRSVRSGSRTPRSLDEALAARRGAAEHGRAGPLAARHGLARAATGRRRRADEGGARPGHRRHARGADGARLPLALAQLRGARPRERRPRGRGRRGRARRARRADRRAARGVRVALPRHATCARPTTRWSRRCARGGAHRSRARRHVRARQGRLARRARRLAAAPSTKARCTCASGSRIPAEQVERARGSAPLERLRRRPAAHRLPEGVHGRDTRLADSAACSTAAACEITSSEELAEIVRRGAARGLPGRGPRDRRSREPARRSTRFEETRAQWQPLGLRHADRARAAARAGGSCRASPSSGSPRRCSSATPRRTATSPTASGPARPTAPTPTARSGTRAPSSRTAPTRRSRSSTRWAGVCAGVLRTIDGRDPGIPSSG